MSLDLTAYDPMLKQHYSKKRIYELADIKNVGFGMVPKVTNAGGKSITQPVDFEQPQGGSAVLATAITNTGASKYEDFIIPRKKNYQIAVIDNETIWASRTNKDAFMPAFKEIDKAFRRAGRRYGIQFYRKAGGAIGRLESGTQTLGAKVLYLETHNDAFNFQVGMEVVFAAANGTGSLRDSGANNKITDINREGGTITFEDNLNGSVTAITDRDYMFAEGDFGVCPSGLEDWIPATAPGSTSFFGVDRTTDIDRLGGLRRNCLGESLLESLIKGVSTVSKHGGESDTAFLNPDTFSDLMLDMEGKVVIDKSRTKARAGIGFKGFTVNVGGQEVTLYPDTNCPANRIFVLQWNTWCWYSAGPAPMFLNRDGLLLRGSTTDDYQVRVGGYSNMGCSAPGYNMNLVLDVE